MNYSSLKLEKGKSYMNPTQIAMLAAGVGTTELVINNSRKSPAAIGPVPELPLSANGIPQTQLPTTPPDPLGYNYLASAVR